MNTQPATKAFSKATSTPRLKFVDTARTLAIISILMGHFFGMVLASEFHSTQHLSYNIWVVFRTYTAPLFITLAGITIGFLLDQCNHQPLTIARRSKRASIRAIILILWGMALHLKLSHIMRYLNGHFESWVYAFHVLQLIGVGVLIVIALFWLHRYVIRIGHVSITYLVAATGVMLAFAHLSTLPDDRYFPMGAPEIIQNAFAGPNSVFPLLPWASYILYGSAIGSLISRFPNTFRSGLLATALTGTGLLLWLLSPIIIGWCNYLLHTTGQSSFNLNNFIHLYERTGIILILLGVLMMFESRFYPIFSRICNTIGKNTLRIYILHVIVLYGGITGWGLNRYLRSTMNIWQATVLGVVFTLLLLALAQPDVILEYLKKRVKPKLT